MRRTYALSGSGLLLRLAFVLPRFKIVAGNVTAEPLIRAGKVKALAEQALTDATRKTVGEGAFNERLFNLGMRDDTAKWAKMIKDTGVKVEQ